MQQINFTGNLSRAEGARMFFIIEVAKEIVLDFSKETVKALWQKLNLKLSNWQLNKLKLATKNGAEVTSNLSSNLIENF